MSIKTKTPDILATVEEAIRRRELALVRLNNLRAAILDGSLNLGPEHEALLRDLMKRGE